MPANVPPDSVEKNFRLSYRSRCPVLAKSFCWLRAKAGRLFPLRPPDLAAAYVFAACKRRQACDPHSKTPMREGSSPRSPVLGILLLDEMQGGLCGHGAITQCDCRPISC